MFSAGKQRPKNLASDVGSFQLVIEHGATGRDSSLRCATFRMTFAFRVFGYKFLNREFSDKCNFRAKKRKSLSEFSGTMFAIQFILYSVRIQFSTSPQNRKNMMRRIANLVALIVSVAVTPLYSEEPMPPTNPQPGKQIETSFKCSDGTVVPFLPRNGCDLPAVRRCWRMSLPSKKCQCVAAHSISHFC
jgi:hypothetical protein